ncbi:MAG: hypothetical protein AAF829_12995 [Pseudomonadota bacterium]
MKFAAALITSLIFTSACATAQEARDPAVLDAEASAEDLIGQWDVSLFFSPNAPPSKTVLVIESVEDGVVTGSFYASPFLAARAIVRDGDVLFTATTEDGSGTYITQGGLKDGEIDGTTFALGRDFLMAWLAVPMDGVNE